MQPKIKWFLFGNHGVFPSAALSRHGKTRVILSRLHCTMYTHNMAAATLNIAYTYRH